MKHPIVEEDIKAIVRSIGNRKRRFEGKTILISGSAGFLGSYFMHVFAELNRTFKRPCRVIGIDNYSVGPRINLLGGIHDKRIRTRKADVCNPLHITGSVDYILHLASIASPDQYARSPLAMIHASVSGTERLLELARTKKVSRFLFFSSSEVYGDPPARFVPTPESYHGNVSTTGPRACYDEAKRLGETLCSVYGARYHVPITIVRPFNVYGPGMRTDDRRVIPRFLQSAFSGKLLTIYGNGRNTRSYCYITDAMDGFFKALLSEPRGEIFNIGIDEEVSLNRLAQAIGVIAPTDVAIRRMPYPKDYPPDQSRRRCPDIAKARRMLRYRPRVSLKDGLARIATWYSTTPS